MRSGFTIDSGQVHSVFASVGLRCRSKQLTPIVHHDALFAIKVDGGALIGSCSPPRRFGKSTTCCPCWHAFATGAQPRASSCQMFWRTQLSGPCVCAAQGCPFSVGLSMSFQPAGCVLLVFCDVQNLPVVVWPLRHANEFDHGAVQVHGRC